jgi:uncharacterized membrane protein YeaQ/YmgE (transglycosylase-associated protein family)
MLATLGQVCELQPTRIIPRQPSGNSQAEDSLFSEPGCIHDCPHQYARGREQLPDSPTCEINFWFISSRRFPRLGVSRIGYNGDGPLFGPANWGEKMDAQALIIWLIVGAIAGWLAGMVVKGGGYGLIGDIIVGIIGGFIAGWLLPQLGIVIGTGIVAAIIDAFIGAVILLLVLRLVKRTA